MKSKTLVLTLGALLSLWAGNAAADTTVTLTSSVSDMMDGAPSLANSNYGNTTTGRANDNVGTDYYSGTPSTSELFRDTLQFDLSSLPADAIIESATLELAFEADTSSSTSTTISLYGLTASWTSSGATWNSRNGTNSWTTPGAESNAAATASSSLTSQFLGATKPGSAVYFSFTGAGLASDVQDWVNDPSSNDGWLIVNSNETTPSAEKSWYTDAAGAGYEPILEITYTMPESVPEPRSVMLLMLGLGSLLLGKRIRKMMTTY